MGFTFNRGIRRTGRGKLVRTSSYGSIFSTCVVDLQYDSAVYRNGIIKDLRELTDPKKWHKSKVKRAKYLKDAVLRGAPLLEGFFADEPSWRQSLLGWCDKVLSQQQQF